MLRIAMAKAGGRLLQSAGDPTGLIDGPARAPYNSLKFLNATTVPPNLPSRPGQSMPEACSGDFRGAGVRLPGKLKEFAKSMKRMLSLVCVLASGLGVSAFAQAAPAKPAPATGTTRVAIINFQQAVAQTNEFQRDFADLQKKYAPREQTLQQLNDKIEALKKQLQGSGATLTDAERQSKLKEIDDDTKNLQRGAEDLRNDEQSDGQETFQQVGQKVFNTMSTFAKQKGFGLVLDASQQNSPVFWFQPTTDITSDVTAAYNAQSGVPAPVPSAPAPNPAARKPAPTTH